MENPVTVTCFGFILLQLAGCLTERIDNDNILKTKVDFRQKREVKNQIVAAGETYKERQRRSVTNLPFNDPEFQTQWYLMSKMNIYKAWSHGYYGQGVILSVVDIGIDKRHPEFSKRFDARASYDFNDHDQDPTPTGSHGMNVAGIAAAEANNNVCGVGIAFKSNIGGIRIATSGVSSGPSEAAALKYNNNYIDIYACAWGPSDFPFKVGYFQNDSETSIKETALKGRGGKGGIFVFAAGNGGITFDDCSYDAYVNSIYTIAVSTLTSKGKISLLSERCPGIIAVTHTRDGALGVESTEDPMATPNAGGGCSKSFSSSSAAAGVAAGIISLTLGANKNLTWRDMQHLIVHSSNNDKTVLKEMKSDDQQTVETRWKVNGAGFKVNNYYGFGLLDAERLVLNAQKWINVPEQITCSIERRGRWRIPGTGQLITQLDFSQWPASCGKEANRIRFLEHVTLTVDLSFDKRGDLEADVISPNGTTSDLIRRRLPDTLNSSTIRNLTVLTLHHWGEDPKGLWTVQFRNGNRNRLSTGYLFGMKLSLYGTITNPVNRSSIVPRNDTNSTTTPQNTATYSGWNIKVFLLMYAVELYVLTMLV